MEQREEEKKYGKIGNTRQSIQVLEHLLQQNKHSARAAVRMHARVNPLERRARALQDCKREK